VNQTKIITAASELARNTVQYGGGGIMHLEVVNQLSRRGLQLTFEDQGPGMPDIEGALKEGYSTSGGLGLGLPGTRRLTDEFELVAHPGTGTRVRIVKRYWLSRTTRPPCYCTKNFCRARDSSSCQSARYGRLATCCETSDRRR